LKKGRRAPRAAQKTFVNLKPANPFGGHRPPLLPDKPNLAEFPMFRRGFSLSYLLPLTVLFISVGIDVHPLLSAKPGLAAAPPAFMPIGPRRYPPGYHALILRPPYNPSPNSAGH